MSQVIEQSESTLIEKETSGLNLSPFQILVFVILSVLAVGFGAYGIVDSMTIGEVTSVDARDIELGQARLGRWCEVSGKLLPRASQEFKTRRSYTHYVPLVSDKWRKGEAVAIIAKFGPGGAPTDSRIRGITTFRDVPSSVLDKLRERGINVHPNYELLEADKSPTERAGTNSLLVLIGIGGGVFAGFAWVQRSTKITSG